MTGPICTGSGTVVVTSQQATSARKHGPEPRVGRIQTHARNLVSTHCVRDLFADPTGLVVVDVTDAVAVDPLVAKFRY